MATVGCTKTPGFLTSRMAAVCLSPPQQSITSLYATWFLFATCFAVWSLVRGLLSKSVGTLTAFIYVEVLILIISVLEVCWAGQAMALPQGKHSESMVLPLLTTSPSPSPAAPSLRLWPRPPPTRFTTLRSFRTNISAERFGSPWRTLSPWCATDTATRPLAAAPPRSPHRFSL